MGRCFHISLCLACVIALGGCPGSIESINSEGTQGQLGSDHVEQDEISAVEAPEVAEGIQPGTYSGVVTRNVTEVTSGRVTLDYTDEYTESFSFSESGGLLIDDRPVTIGGLFTLSLGVSASDLFVDNVRVDGPKLIVDFTITTEAKDAFGIPTVTEAKRIDIFEQVEGDVSYRSTVNIDSETTDGLPWRRTISVRGELSR